MTLLEQAYQKGMPKIKGNTLDDAITIVKWTGEYLVRVRETENELREHYGRRSPQKIFERGKSNFFAPCVDNTSLSALLLSQGGFKGGFQLMGSREGTRGLHTRLSIKLDDTVIFEYGKRRTYYFFPHITADSQTNVHEVGIDTLNEQTPVLQSFSDQGIFDVSSLLPNYDYEHMIRSIRYGNREQGFLEVQKQRNYGENEGHTIPCNITFLDLTQ